MEYAIIVLTIYLAYEDHQHNSISLWGLGLHIAFCLFYFFINEGFWLSTAIGLLMLLMMYLCLSLYFSWKIKAWVNIADRMIGKGDLIWLLAIPFVLMPIDLLWFLIIGQVVSLALYFLFYKKRALPYLVGLGLTFIGFLIKSLF